LSKLSSIFSLNVTFNSNRGGFDTFGQNNYRNGGRQRDGAQGRYPQGGRNDGYGGNFNGGYMNAGAR
jgi:hypothetical protein